MRYVVCYDVSDNKRRRRLSICLDGYGDRVQESVFEVVLTGELQARMAEEVKERIRGTDDAVQIYPLCANCAAKVQRLGNACEAPGEEVVFVV
ncbi:MAG: CRISPR-associated endonuclease Cas2 [Magnetococcales bacterium]|nr:CRISPR-associated endonuclease Cas2 [Magnetococcales bacterium]